VRLTTNAYPKEQRQEAWRFALQRLSIELLDSQSEIYGELVAFRSALDMQFIRIVGTRQSLVIDFSQSTPCIWLVLLLDGELTVTSGSTVRTLAEGGMVCGGDLVGARLDLHGDSRLLVTRVPQSLPALKSRTPAPVAITYLDGATGLGGMFSGLLASVAETLDDVGPDQMRPVEAALPEFIAALLLDAAPDKDRGGSAGGRASLLDRVFQTIEVRLSDPDLDLQQVAKEHGISSRYLQKLFASIDESFGHFLKARRLERCRLDLGSPLHAQKSISEILFQWGFNDSASFSRAFREQYGVSPREYRKTPAANDEGGQVLLRGSPASARKLRRGAPLPPPVEEDDAEIAETGRPRSLSRRPLDVACATIICRPRPRPSTGAISAARRGR
jgi:AraC-like DNA-binding protein